MPPTDKEKKFKQLKTARKAKIMAWHENGLSSRKIAAHLGRDQSTIVRVAQNSKKLEGGTVPERKKGSGRPKKVTKTHLGMIRRQIMKYPSMTASDLRQTVPELAFLSDRTIQRSLQKHLNIPSRCAAQKPLLTEKMKKKRIAFFKAYKDWTPKQWEKVMYLDESTFRCIRST
jgi:transposase